MTTPSSATPQNSAGPEAAAYPVTGGPPIARPISPAARAASLLYVFSWAKQAGLRSSALQVLLAIGLGHNTPPDICAATGLSPNGTWVALRNLLGTGRAHHPGQGYGPRNEPLIGRRPDPHAGRERCYLYGLTDQGQHLLNLLTAATDDGIPDQG